MTPEVNNDCRMSLNILNVLSESKYLLQVTMEHISWPTIHAYRLSHQQRQSPLKSHVLRVSMLCDIHVDAADVTRTSDGVQTSPFLSSIFSSLTEVLDMSVLMLIPHANHRSCFNLFTVKICLFQNGKKPGKSFQLKKIGSNIPFYSPQCFYYFTDLGLYQKLSLYSYKLEWRYPSWGGKRQHSELHPAN